MKKLPFLVLVTGLAALGCSAYQPDGSYPEPPRKESPREMTWRFLEDVPVSPSDRAEPPRAVSQKKVQYSESARKQRITGSVVLDVTLDAEGNVTDVALKQPLEPSLDENALRTVREWKYQPARLNGVARPSIIEVTVEFMVA